MKKASFAIFLCVGLALGLNAMEINLPKNAKIGKTLEGKQLQEVLQKVANSKKGAVEKNTVQNSQNVFGLDTELVDNINAVIMEQPSFLTENSFVVYADSNDIVIDIRNAIGL